MLGINIKKLRERQFLTQKELAGQLGVSRQAVAMWEAGQRELKATMLNKLANVFGVTIDEIIKIKREYLIKREDIMIFKRKKKKSINFELKAPEAKKVIVTGDFNSWKQTGIEMTKRRDGIWKADIDLNVGRYQYKFIVDNQWWVDPKNTNTAVSECGTINSVLEVAV